jgi:uncharacterized membrane protein YjgN (DUF898 family)
MDTPSDTPSNSGAGTRGPFGGPARPDGGPSQLFTPPPPVEHVKLSWVQPDGLVGLSFANYFLRIITLGVYHFWGKTEVRRRIWSAVRLNGEPLSYTGTGKELFLGFLIVFGVVLLPMLLATFAAVYAFGPKSGAVQVIQTLSYGVFFSLMGIGIYRAQRYRLSRTLWRGIRGGLDGSTGTFAGMHIWTAILVPFTLGWITPWRQTKLQSLLVNSMRFGDRPLVFDAKSGKLYKRFAALWFGAVILGFVTLTIIGLIGGQGLQSARRGVNAQQMSPAQVAAIVATLLVALLIYSIISAWYRAGMMNHFAAHTHFEGASFVGTATAPSLIRLAIGNFCLTIFTLGILAPLAQIRTARYAVERTAIKGPIPLAGISQRAAAGGKYGEGLAQAFDFDAF